MALLASLLLTQLPVSLRVRQLLIGGLWLRLGGAVGYLNLFNAFYGGGDYLMYYQEGLWYATNLLAGNWDFVLEPWMMGQWHDTPFVIMVTGVILSIVGNSLLAAFLVYSALSYAAMVMLAVAFARVFIHVPLERYLAWIALFPSLWFWPSAVGKEALMLLAVGMAVLGFVGKNGRTGWVLLVVGVALAYAVRPQVSIVLVFVLVAAQWLGGLTRLNGWRLAQGVALMVAGVFVVAMAGDAIGIDLFAQDEAEEYLDRRASASDIGGSAVGEVTPWLAPVNVFLRPFLWEARSVPLLIAAFEVVVLWSVAWFRRREIGAFVRAHWRRRLFWVALLFVVMYGVALGMSLGNLGIIARQRIHLLPFLFVLFAGLPRARGRALQAGEHRVYRAWERSVRPLAPSLPQATRVP